MVLGPLYEPSFDSKKKRIVFRTGPGAPVKHLALDPERLLKLYVGGSGGEELYAVYRSENEDYYRHFLAKLPPSAEEKEKLVFSYYGCPLGHPVDEEAAEEELLMDGAAHCPDCQEPLEEVVRLVWVPRSAGSPTQGEADIFVFDRGSALRGFRLAFGSDVEEYYSSMAGHCYPLIVKTMEKRTVEWKGNSILVETGLGVMSESHYDETPRPAYRPGVYEVYTLRDREELRAYRLVKELTLEDFLANIDVFANMREEMRDCLAADLANRWGEEKAKPAVVALKPSLELLAELYPAEYGAEYIRRAWEEARSAAERGDAPRPAYLSDQALSQLSEDVRREYDELWNFAKEMEKRVEEEEKRRREELERRWEAAREELRRRDEQALRDAGFEARVEFEDRYTLTATSKRYLEKQRFKEFTEELRELGYKFDWRSKEWRKDIFLSVHSEGKEGHPEEGGLTR